MGKKWLKATQILGKFSLNYLHMYLKLRYIINLKNEATISTKLVINLLIKRLNILINLRRKNIHQPVLIHGVPTLR